MHYSASSSFLSSLLPRTKEILPRQSDCPDELAPPAQLSSAKDVQLGLWLREFRAYLQPKFDLHTGEVNAAEVLARWHHPLHGVLGPAHFLPLIKQERWLDDLLFALLEQGLAYQLQLHRMGRSLKLAFNLSLSQLNSSKLVERLETRLLEHPVRRSSLTFEITEDGPADLSDAHIEQLNRLSRLGIRLSIDDFGTGYSSLLRLCKVVFHEIKLPRDFIGSVDSSERHRAVVRNALALANALGMEAVVEGIETLSQRNLLVDMGARVGQGYLCAKPMSLEEFDSWKIKLYQRFQTLICNLK
ncbi:MULTISPECIES: EAL domain-containing protein [Pseudomonas]|nr:MULTISPECIES: EAL domain-containing protein [Pseudomonas]MCK3838808.1 EAL domain-containing protein [Pseudomonas sp. NCIMB 10586]MCK3846875.1 EAL domain-containing protein [Pseudomonas sp. W15Feb34]VCU67927.1 Uncharacterized signaling protein PA1727 [Pseudomonas synxantha]